MTAIRCDTQSSVLSDCISSMHEYLENVFRVVQNLKFPDHRLESAPPSANSLQYHDSRQRIPHCQHAVGTLYGKSLDLSGLKQLTNYIIHNMPSKT